MNVMTIISEEMKAAEARIKARMAEMFLGGILDPSALLQPRSPAPRPPQASGATPVTPVSQRGSPLLDASTDADANADLIVEYLKENPGAHSPAILNLLGCSSSTDRKYINAMKRLWAAKRVISRGQGRVTAYWHNPKAQKGKSKKAKTSQRGHNNAPKLADPKARDDKLVAWFRKHPNSTVAECVNDLFGPKSLGSKDAIKSALNRLCGNETLIKKHTKKRNARGQPRVEIRAG